MKLKALLVALGINGLPADGMTTQWSRSYPEDVSGTKDGTVVRATLARQGESLVFAIEQTLSGSAKVTGDTVSFSPEDWAAFEVFCGEVRLMDFQPGQIEN